MATPRRRYPSDHRPYFRVVDDILDDEKLQGEEWMLSAYIRALAMLNRSHSRDGSIRVSHSTLEAMMGRRRRDVALTRLRRCVNVGLMLAARYADYTLIFIPNWPKIQGFTPAELRCDSGATPALRVEERRSGEKTPEHSPSKTRESGVAHAPPPPLDDPKRWVSILGQEAGSDEEKLVFTTRELPLAVAEAEEHHPSDRKAQRGKIKSVLIRHYRWQRANPVPMRAQANGARRPVTFAEQSAINTKQAARDAMAIFDARRKEETDARGILEAGGSSEADPAHPPLLGPRH